VVKVDQFNHVPAIADLPTEALDPRAIPGPQLRELTALMYPAHDFGTKLLTQHLQPALEAAGLWRTGLLGSISYSDRYLHAPLPMLLLLQTAAALKQALATQDSPDLPVHVATQTLRDGGGRGSPSRLEQDWPREADRRETTAALAATLRLALRMRSGAAPHQRRMELRFTDGVRAVLLFDQGFGCWRAIGNDRHNFNASGAQQAEALLGLTSGISCTPSFLIVTSG
jgi:DEAD/DEAH box helicase domain-containing protein